MLAVFEDAHWSDPSSLELLDMMIERAERLPILVLITFRPEFVPPWAGLAHVSLVLLNRLGSSQTAALATHIAGDKPLPAEIIDRIVEAVKHFTRAIELLPAVREGAERNRLEFGLNAALGDAMGEIKGYNAPEVQEVFSRAQTVLDVGSAQGKPSRQVGLMG